MNYLQNYLHLSRLCPGPKTLGGQEAPLLLRLLAWSPALRLGLLALAAFAAVVLLAGPPAEPAQAQTLGWNGIVPPRLSEGTKYRILFVTSGLRNAQSRDISTYNAFVQKQADGAAGNPFEGVTFKVLGSTAEVDARCNTQTHRQVSDCGGAATVDDATIYYYRGGKVADDYADLYDGSWDSQRPRNQHGSNPSANTLVLTGSGPDGTEAFTISTSRALGSSGVRGGSPKAAGSELSSSRDYAHVSLLRFYALSEVLTAPEPEPSPFEGDYDADNDRLIEITDLAQLNAMRWDLDGNGTPRAAKAGSYALAFPDAEAGMGCPATCRGYELMADLDFDTDGDGSTHTGGVGDPGDTYYNGGSGWDPLGDGSTPYRAVFDGNGRTIANLFIDRDSSNYVGLFGEFNEGAEMRNLGVVDAHVTGNRYVGALIGRHFRGDTITDSYATGSVTGHRDVGGLIGWSTAHGTITDSYSTASVSGMNNVGGLVGYNSGGPIINSFATGRVVGDGGTGGLIGFVNGGTITNSYATGRVSGDGTLGGLAGYILDTVVVTNSYATGRVTGDISNSGLVGGNGTVTDSYWDTETSGRSTSGGGVGKTTAQLQKPTGYTGIYANWDMDEDGNTADPWDFGTANQYPVLKDLDLAAQRGGYRDGLAIDWCSPVVYNGSRECVFLDSLVIAVEDSYNVNYAARELSKQSGWTVKSKLTNLRMLLARHVPGDLTFDQLEAEKERIEQLPWAKSVGLNFAAFGVPEEDDEDARSVPAQPQNLALSATERGDVTLTWNNPGGVSVTGYRIQRRVKAPQAKFLVIEEDTGSTETRYVDRTAAAGNKYAYRVIAINEAGLSPPSRHAAIVLLTGDGNALMALYHATGGEDWTNNANWNTAASLGQWHGVTVDGQGRVTALKLKKNGLSGELPQELGDLAMLEELNLTQNDLSGNIPAALGGLANLRDLRMAVNDISGEIPEELGGLANLEALVLAGNELSGEIPEELGNLARLRELQLHGNELTGEIPPELGDLVTLEKLFLRNNQFSGCIPAALQDVTQNDFDRANVLLCE